MFGLFCCKPVLFFAENELLNFYPFTSASPNCSGRQANTWPIGRAERMVTSRRLQFPPYKIFGRRSCGRPASDCDGRFVAGPSTLGMPHPSSRSSVSLVYPRLRAAASGLLMDQALKRERVNKKLLFLITSLPHPSPD